MCDRAPEAKVVLTWPAENQCWHGRQIEVKAWDLSARLVCGGFRG